MAIERQTPRISLNQLAEYLSATAYKRRKIVKEQKYPDTFRVNWYDLARKPISDFILGGCDDEEILVTAVNGLYTKKEEKKNDKSKFRTNAEAINAFLGTYEQIIDDDLKILEGANDPPKLKIKDVEISVRPDFRVFGKYRGKRICGALKLYFSKDHALTDDAGAYIAAVVHSFISKNPAKNLDVSTRHCQVLDVFRKRTFCAPSATTRRLREIEAACEEIKLLWAVV